MTTNMMKTVSSAVLVLGSLWLLACGTGPSRDGGPVGGNLPPDSLPRRTQRIELRLAGVEPGDYQRVVVGLSGVWVSVKGEPVAFTPAAASRRMELTPPGHAHLLGYVDLPDDVDGAEVVLRFDEAGVYAEGGDGGLIRAGDAEIRFTARREDLAPRRRAVVQLRLKDSLVAHGAERRLLPATVVAY